VERGREAYEFARGDVGLAVTNAVGVYRYRAEREGVELTLRVDEALPAARIDERAIQLAVINLIDNALKYAPDGKTIAIEAALRDDSIAVRVTDQGPGVAEDDRERIFERFVRGSHPRGAESTGARSGPVRGSGIGLALVKHIAESHGGRAWVEAGVGAGSGTHGSAFIFTVPVLA
jgi:two-component system phosphate regulon sensor histidine kinase PhoR